MNGIEFCKKGEGRSKQEGYIQSGADKLTLKEKGINICHTRVHQVFDPPSRSILSTYIPTLQMRNLSFREAPLLVQAHKAMMKQS